jgi:hypothetical protein
MFKKILLVLSLPVGIIVSLLLISNAFKFAVIPDQYCKKINTTIHQCIPGCVWQLHEDVYKGVDIEQNSTAFFPQNEPTCEGR